MELYRQASVGVALTDALDEMVAVRRPTKRPYPSCSRQLRSRECSH